MMEIGYFYYKMKYTKDEEEQVEETRMKKTRQRRRRGKKSNNPTLPIPNAVVNKQRQRDHHQTRRLERKGLLGITIVTLNKNHQFTDDHQRLPF